MASTGGSTANAENPAAALDNARPPGYNNRDLHPVRLEVACPLPWAGVFFCLWTPSFARKIPPPPRLTTPSRRATMIAIYSPSAGSGLSTSLGGCFLLLMDAIVFIDGQNLYHLAKAAWLGDRTDQESPYAWPSYDVEKLANALVAREPGRTLAEIRFYTGVPNPSRGPTQKFWHDFWLNRFRHFGNRGIYAYRGQVSRGRQEKGVDVSLAIDLVQATHERRYQVAIIVSQDSDFGPAVKLCKSIAASQNRQVAFESAFPEVAARPYQHGIPGTTWVPIDQATYDACRDFRNYLPPRPRTAQE